MNVGTLYELLDRLPERCDDFTVRFTLHDRSEWIQPECWHVTVAGDLMLNVFDDDYHEEFTVLRLKNILDGCENGGVDDNGVEQEIYIDQDVFVVTGEDEETDYCYIVNDRFEINWKRERVDAFIEYD